MKAAMQTDVDLLSALTTEEKWALISRARSGCVDRDEGSTGWYVWTWHEGRWAASERHDTRREARDFLRAVKQEAEALAEHLICQKIKADRKHKKEQAGRHKEGNRPTSSQLSRNHRTA